MGRKHLVFSSGTMKLCFILIFSIVFSRTHKTFTQWRRAVKESAYKRRIIRLRQFLKRAPLKVLSKTSIKAVTVALTSWKKLSPEEKSQRKLAFEVKRLMSRKRFGFARALREVGAREDIIRKHLGQFLFKQGKRWLVKKFDTIEVSMLFYARGGKRITIVTTNSRDRTIIGEYFNAVQDALNFRDFEGLKEFKDIVIIDADGKKHRFEVDIEKILEMLERVEEPHLREIYWEL